MCIFITYYSLHPLKPVGVDGKFVTSTPGGQSPWFVAFPDFHGVNISIIADFKLSTVQQRNGRIPENLTKLHKPAPAHCL